jgi:hypothetical protein
MTVRCLELDGLPPKGDASDWLDAGGTKAELLAMAQAAPMLEANGTQRTTRQRDGKALGKNPTGQRITQRDEGDEALSRCALGSVGQPAAPFPLDVLPGPIAAFVRAIAEALPCPLDFPGAMVLVVLAMAIRRKVGIEIKPGWVEYPLLWIAVVARSGDRKSPALEKATEPIRAKQKELLAKFQKALEAFRKKKTEIEPILEQILTTDTTIEALKDILAGNPLGIIFAADELAGWVRALCQYKGGRGDDRQHWLTIWCGGQIISNRKSSPLPIVINNPYVSIVGGIQPDALPDLIEDGREDGLAARFLVAYPEPPAPAAWNENSVTGEAEYRRIFEALWALPIARKPIPMASPAKQVWIDWVNRHRVETPPDNLRPTWAKAEGHCARLALVLCLSHHVCNETTANEIDEASMRGAVKLIDYFKAHAIRVYSKTADTKDNGRIGNALRFVRRHGGVVTARRVRMNGLCKSSAEAEELLHDLAELGHGTVTDESRGSKVFRLREMEPQELSESAQAPTGTKK